MPEHEIKFYRDRMPISDLGVSDRHVITVMGEWNIGLVDQRSRVHFCGMIRLPKGRIIVFLPRNMSNLSKESAALTMLALQRFGSDTSSRETYSDGQIGNSGIVSVIRQIADDFRTNGIFVERQRLRTRNIGKPDWKRTVSREVPFPCQGGGEVFENIATTRTLDSRDTLLAQIQAAVVGEIVAHHSWWIEGIDGRHAELRGIRKPHQPRDLWPKLLDDLLLRLFSDRSIFLAKSLSYYLRECRASGSGSFLFGVEDFHTVWEIMLRQTLLGVETGWNSRLPKPVYRRRDGLVASAKLRGLQTDMIIKRGHDFVVADAKYYAAISPESAPGVADITKQMFYELALREVVGSGASIYSVFLFPSQQTGPGPLTSIDFVKEGNSPVANFPIIYCVYIQIDMVMAAYVQRSRVIELPPLNSVSSGYHT